VNELFAVFGSCPFTWLAEPVVVYELAGSAFDGVAWTVTVAAPPPFMAPRLQLRLLLPSMLQVPCVVVKEFCSRVAPLGAVVTAVKFTQPALMLPVPFLICQVKVTGDPCGGLPLLAEPVTCRSAADAVHVLFETVVVAVNELLAVFWSLTKPDGSVTFTVEALVKLPVEFGSSTVTVTVAEPATGIAPRAQLNVVRVAVPVQMPCEKVEDTYPAGSVSLNPTEGATAGPLLWMVIV